MKSPTSAVTPSNRAGLSARYARVRSFTESLAAPLAPEDCVIQSMTDVSPTRWHLAHTTWFFETFILAQAVADYSPYDPAFAYLFNSYYNSIGDQFPRDRRGVLSRPTVAEVFNYRHCIDERLQRLLENDALDSSLLPALELGIQHEQQHQELILTDIKHVLSCNPLFPVYRSSRTITQEASPSGWMPFSEGIYSIGHGADGFSFDNETPRHKVYLRQFELQTRLVTNEEYMAFINDRGYERPEFWLSAGWNQVRAAGWTAPLYWIKRDGWRQFTLSGLRPLDPSEPVCHVSYFEADAFARWGGVRLPTEAEWEIAATGVPIQGNFVESERLHPSSGPGSLPNEAAQLFGDVWEWTSSAYAPYPGFRPAEGALGEYNGKFMCNQYVLRGGSCVTSCGHMRASYRNFFPPETRWQFSGIRLCR